MAKEPATNFLIYGFLGSLFLAATFLSASGESMLWLALVPIIMVIYMMPTIIAIYRHHRNQSAIAVLNIFVGWSFLGWVIALVWSFTADVA